MTKPEFIKILAEEGIDNGKLIDDLWNSRPAGDLPEEKLRKTARHFKQQLPTLLAKERLSNSLERARQEAFG